ncbi:ECF RNA polymerase sigma factor SigW [compost metagenome]
MEEKHYQYMSEISTYDIERMMDEFGEDVWQYAFFLTKKHDMADDIAQEVFIKAYRAVQSFRGQSSLKTWLLKITRNTAYSHFRNPFYKRAVLMQHISLADTRKSAESDYMEQEFAHEIWSLVMRLSTKYREVIVLSGHYHLSMEEIADALQISVSTAKTRLHRARKALYKLMKEGQDSE